LSEKALIIAKRISWATEAHGLLPCGHMGARKGGQACSLHCLDVLGAYDNVSHPRLIHNLRKRSIGGVTADWIESFLKDRSSVLKIPDFTTEPFEVGTGI
jgi:hypothetical protein